MSDAAVQELRDAYRRDSAYQLFVSPRSRRVLEEMIDAPSFPGATDPPVLATLATLVQIVRPQRVLQLGTFVGFSSVVLADVLRTHGGGRLVTVDPDPTAHRQARGWLRRAGLDEGVTFVDGYSTDRGVGRELGQLGPFDLAYLDSSHAYAETRAELDLLFREDGWLRESGLLVLHDAALEAARFDPSGAGGVRKALDEWLAAQREPYQSLVLEPPLWPCVCGIGLVSRRGHAPAL